MRVHRHKHVYHTVTHLAPHPLHSHSCMMAAQTCAVSIVEIKNVRDAWLVASRDIHSHSQLHRDAQCLRIIRV